MNNSLLSNPYRARSFDESMNTDIIKTCGGVIIRDKQLRVPIHKCAKPGMFSRLFRRIMHGDYWRCGHCFKTYKWCKVTGEGGYYDDWIEIDSQTYETLFRRIGDICE